MHTRIAVTMLVAVVAAAGCKKEKRPDMAPTGGAVDAGASTATPPDMGSAARVTVKVEELDWDGFKLGDKFLPLVDRSPWNQPCDVDPIEQKTRRIVVYTGLACREKTFPDGQSVILYLKFAEGSEQAEMDQPIEAVAWLGGKYFDQRLKFPLKAGEPAARARELLGQPEGLLMVEGKERPLKMERYPGRLTVVISAEVIVGFVAGDMPAAAEAESWEAIEEIYRRYTPAPAGASASRVARADCERAIDHVASVLGTHSPQDADELRKKRDRKVEQCLKDATPEQMACILAAGDMKAINACR